MTTVIYLNGNYINNYLFLSGLPFSTIKSKLKVRYQVLGKTETSLVFMIKQDIVEKIIGEMFFHIDEHGSITQARALKLFQLTEEGFYRVVIKSPTQFHLVVEWIAHGLSFRQVEAAMTSIRNRLSVASVIHCINDGEVASIARIICAANLQTLSSLLNDDSVWAFSLANDGSTHYGRSYLDNRIRVYYQGTLHNFHLIAVPMFERHTANNLVELITRILDVLCSSWREKLIGLGSDGENKMTGQHTGVVTQIERQAQHRVYRTWCALHQLDLVMQYGYKDLMNGKFLKYTTDFISHLHQQYSLIAEMQSTCPKLTNRWIIMGTVCRWFLEHRDRLLQFVQDPDCSELTRKVTPPAWWWIAVAAVAGITETVNVVFIKLQGKDITVEQQSESLEELSVFLCTQVGVRGSYDRNQLRVLNPMRFSICGRWALEETQLEDFLHGQSTFVLTVLTALRQDDRVMLLASIGNMIVSYIDGILDIKAERNARNEPGEDIPPVLPHRLVKLRGKEFMNIISQHYA